MEQGKLRNAWERVLFWIKKPWVQAILIGILFTTFLWPKGVWLYQDDIFLAKNVAEAWQHLRRLFSSLEIADYYSTYFGYESTYFNIGRILCYPIYLIFVIVFRDAGVAQLIFFALFFGITFLVIRALIGFFSKNKLGVFLGALFFVSSQWVLFFFTLPGFAFALLGLPLFIVSLLHVLNKNYRIFPLLGLALSGFWILSYQRLFLMYGAVALFVVVMCAKQIWKERKKVLIYIPVLLALCLPIIFGILITLQDLSFGESFNNYQDFFRKAYGTTSYTQMLKRDVFTAIHFSAPANSFLVISSSRYFVIYFILALVIGFGVTWLLVRHMRWTWLRVVLMIVYFGGSFLVSLAHFVNVTNFVKITYDILPFLANEPANAKILALLVTAIAIPVVMTRIQTKKFQIVFISAVLLYIACSVFPLFYPTYKKGQIDFDKDVPKVYQEEFFSKEEREPYVYYPNTVNDWKDPYGLFYAWAPTAMEFNQNLKYRQLMTGNVRLASIKQAQLFYMLTRYPDSKYAKYFNLKNIIVYKDVRNSEPGRFDYFPNSYDFIANGNKTLGKLKENTNFTVKENDHFAIFRPKDVDAYDYFLYSPSLVKEVSPKTIFLPINDPVEGDKPLLIDWNAYHKPDEAKPDVYGADINKNENVHVDAKTFVRNRGKILVKISNINPSSDFFLQLNQTLQPQWRIASISKEEYEGVACSNKKDYERTQNSTCEASAHTLDLSATHLLWQPRIEGRHFEGNVIGNGWIMKHEEYSKFLDKDGNLYVAIYYRRQIYYQLSLLFSLSLFGIGFVAACIQEIVMKAKKKKWNKEFVLRTSEVLKEKFQNAHANKGDA